MENFDKENKYLRAKEKVEELKKFYSNLTSYLVVIPGLAIINYLTNGFNYAWFLWPALGWGIGLAFHAAKAFGWSPIFNRDWEERKIREYMDRDDQEKGLTKNLKWWE